MSQTIPNWQLGARATIHGLLHGQQTVNVLNFATEQGPTPDSVVGMINEIGTAIVECVVQTLLPAVTADWTFTMVKVRAFWPQESDEIVAVPGAPAVGQLGPASHSFSASLMNINTNGGGRSGRGRIFLPPPGEAQVANSIIDGPTLVLIAAFGLCLNQKFMGQNPTTNWRLGVFSRTRFSGVTGSFQAAFRQATSLVANPDCAVIRSRRRGKGN